MKIRLRDSKLLGEALGFDYDEDGEVVFTCLFYGCPGTREVLASLLESV